MPLTLHDKLALMTIAEDVSWKEILQASGLQQYIIKEISPRAVIIEPAAVEPLITWLRKHSYLPKIIQ